jgi:low affinity Fe/Cu permease
MISVTPIHIPKAKFEEVIRRIKETPNEVVVVVSDREHTRRRRSIRKAQDRALGR